MLHWLAEVVNLGVGEIERVFLFAFAKKNILRVSFFAFSCSQGRTSVDVVGSWALCCVHLVICLVGWRGSCLATLEPSTVGSVILVGSSVVQGHGKRMIVL